MVLLPVAHFGARHTRARKAHVGTLGSLKAIYIYINTLPLGSLWQSLAGFGKVAKLSTKATFGILGTLEG